MIKVVVYTRVSSEEQTHGYSLEIQEEACERYAEQNNMKVVKVFREEGVSAKAERKSTDITTAHVKSVKTT